MLFKLRLLLLTSLILVVISKTCLVTFSSRSVPGWSTPQLYPLPEIEQTMTLWLETHPDAVILSSGLSRSDDESRCYYTGHFLYTC